MNEFSFEITEGGLALTAYNGGDEHVTVPAEHGGQPVVAVAEGAFSRYYSVEAGTDYMPSIRTSLKGAAVKSVTLPKGLRTIGRRAFADNRVLESVFMPDTVETIGESAFEECSSLKSALLPPSARDIGKRAFYGCTALSELRLGPKGVRIGESAFAYCDSLWTADLRGVSHMEKGAFADCGALCELYLPDADLPERCFAGCGGLTSAAIPSGAVYVGSRAFAGCSALGRVILRGKHSIAHDAFLHCRGLSVFVTDRGVIPVMPGLQQEGEAGRSAFFVMLSDPEVGVEELAKRSQLEEDRLFAGIAGAELLGRGALHLERDPMGAVLLSISMGGYGLRSLLGQVKLSRAELSAAFEAARGDAAATAELLRHKTARGGLARPFEEFEL